MLKPQGTWSVLPVPLLPTRIRNASTFEIASIDLGRPLSQEMK